MRGGAVKAVLLTINDVYWLIGATIYVGVLTTLRLFLYQSWTALRPDTTHDHFTVPTDAATKFFLIAIPTWMFTAIVMIVSEWGNPEVWLAIVAFVGLLTTTTVGWFGIQPINREIKAGVDEARLTVLLQKWMKINDLRWAAVIIMWCALCAYFVAKPDLPGILG
jgi:hypothetical protein